MMKVVQISCTKSETIPVQLRLAEQEAPDTITSFFKSKPDSADNVILCAHSDDDKAHFSLLESVMKWYRILWLKGYILRTLSYKNYPALKMPWKLFLDELSEFRRALNDNVEVQETTNILLNDERIKFLLEKNNQARFSSILQNVRVWFEIGRMYFDKA